MSGRLLVVEGPNGVGKTTVCAHLAAELRDVDPRIHATTQPSQSPLGRLVRTAEATLTGRALALAIAADRAHQVEEEIIPHLNAGFTVVCDRYVPSSLVLQRLDGLALDEIWTYNQYVIPPALTVYLEHDTEVIAERLTERQSRSRLENAGGPVEELALYGEAREFLETEGWRQIVVDCRNRTPVEVAASVLAEFNAPEVACSPL
ncbi:dTMP kinase [Glycomyces tenuis]|uniref:dTMP kinase n=1 Tax=Glycomyces tenuis TaxID=58116 RepID=UPI00047D2497|nr:dTMP kinase [Glycomyces tenuis]